VTRANHKTPHYADLMIFLLLCPLGTNIFISTLSSNILYVRWFISVSDVLHTG